MHGVVSDGTRRANAGIPFLGLNHPETTSPAAIFTTSRTAPTTMDMKRYLHILPIMSVIAAVSATAHAADIRTSDDKLCAFKLDGEIIPGDFDKLLNIFVRNADKFDQFDERTESICLKSIGGSYVEALKIAELIYKKSLSTVVEYASECSLLARSFLWQVLSMIGRLHTAS